MADGMQLHMQSAATKFHAKLQSFQQLLRSNASKAVHDQMIKVRGDIINTTPVDTGNLRAHWSTVRQRSELSWGIGNDRMYAPILEYGGYKRVGPRTIEAGPADLGEGFEAPEGIYSQQAPLGWTRKALVANNAQFRQRILNTVVRTWG